MTASQQPRVVHVKKAAYDVYIGRPSEWGNPFSHIKGKGEIHVPTREDAIRCYEAWLKLYPEKVERACSELRGKVLGCWCAPQPCHGDVLVRLANT